MTHPSLRPLTLRTSTGMPSSRVSGLAAIIMIGALAALADGASAQGINLSVGVDFPTIYGANAFAVGDLNNDGWPDIVACGSTNQFFVFLATGRGAFGPPISVPTPAAPGAIAIADVNGDGKLDVVTSSSTISVFLGDGTGAYAAHSDYPNGLTEGPFAVGDLNGDGVPDVAVVTSNNTVSVLLGSGAGGFGAPTPYTTGQYPATVAIGDLNGDGRPDLVVPNGGANSVSVFLGRGDGSFAAKTDYPTASQPHSVAIGDLNSDGRLDVVIGCNSFPTGQISVLLGTGGGVLGPNTDYSFSGASINAVAIADFNGDGIPDVAGATNGSSVEMMPGTGGGTLGTPTIWSCGASPLLLAVADLDGNGHPDLVVSSIYSGFTVDFNNGAGQLASHVEYGTGANPQAFAIGDVSGDGKKDVIVANRGANTVSVMLGNGAGGLGAHTDFATGSTPLGVAIADVSSDGRPDLLVANNGANTLSVLLGNGTGGFGAKTDFATGAAPSWVATGDLNGDGKPDAVTANYSANTVSVLLGNGTGGFAAKVDYATGTNPQSAVLADVSGDGKLDVVAANFTSNTVSVLLGNGAGVLGAKTDYTTGTNPYSVAVGDLNGDGRPDIVTANLNASSVSVLFGSGGGAYGAKTDYTTLTNPSSVSITDVNGDGRPDLVVGNVGATSASVFLGNGAGGFGPRTDYPVAGGSFGSTVGDLNADGRPDVIVGNYGLGSISVLLGLEPTHLAVTTNPAQPVPDASYACTANVTVPAPGSGTPTGSVSFFDGVQFIGSTSLVSGIATISIFNPQLVSHTITATYSGDAKYLPSTVQVAMPTRLGPHIARVRDVPGDQGGSVELRWDASPIDRGSPDPIAQYRIYRQVPSAFATRSLASGARRLVTASTADPVAGDLMAKPANAQTYYWEYLSSVTASHFSGYSLVAPTGTDSTGASNPRTLFMVEALDTGESLQWDSAPDSGYSVDNLAPAAVTPFTGTYSAGTASLHWGASTAPDFASYLLYRGSTPDFVPGPATLVIAKSDTGYVDGAALLYYKLAAEDVHGNVGPYTSLTLSNTLDAPGGGPFAFALGRVRPNPASGRRLVAAFTLPRAQPATLELLDVSGRRITSREVGSLGPGPHTVELDGGTAAIPGLYWLRLTQGTRAGSTRVAIVN